MSINQSTRLVLALLAGLLLVGITVIISSTFNLPPIAKDVERTSTPLTMASQNAEFTPEIPFSFPSQTLSVTSTPSVISTITASKIVLTTKVRLVALRAGPHINHPGVSRNYDKGTPMEVLGTHEGWYLVIAPDGTKGWLYEEWLNIDAIDLANIPIVMIVPTAPLNTRVPPDPEPNRPPQPQEMLPSPYP